MNYRIEQLRFLLREDPSSRVFYQLAELLRKEGEAAEAVEILRAGLDKHPRYVAAWVSLGRALQVVGKPREAQEALRRALELDPENAVAARILAETAINREDWDQAARSLRLAADLAPSDTVEERIAFVEERMADGESAPPPAEVRPVEVVRLSTEEPFAVNPEDTGYFQLPQDVFRQDEPEPASLATGPISAMEIDDASAAPMSKNDELPAATAVAESLESEEAALEPTPPAEVAEPEPEEEPSPEPDPDDETVISRPRSTQPPTSAPPPAPAAAERDISSDTEQPVEGELPLATMTLARLALEQGDRLLAENTLFSLVERDPGNAEAQALLAQLRADTAREGALAAVEDVVEGKVSALRGWLNTIRRAAERRVQ